MLFSLAEILFHMRVGDQEGQGNVMEVKWK